MAPERKEPSLVTYALCVVVDRIWIAIASESDRYMAIPHSSVCIEVEAASPNQVLGLKMSTIPSIQEFESSIEITKSMFGKRSRIMHCFINLLSVSSDLLGL
ncbi:Hypothetical predicted protein [Olea europaea subsp. europaea]|uniref:Uncharacterized protein n=1 Tax=Olea europaea subsp. europaea TaxID=158383 RepID=A0A8S0UNM1_OLEEU|nr:Hypothetical predicted protein [Olea europaea subsp. europaea]